MRTLRGKLTYANVMATIAVFIVDGETVEQGTAESSPEKDVTDTASIPSSRTIWRLLEPGVAPDPSLLT